MTVHISYVSDVLCIWAYVEEARLDNLRKEFKGAIELEYRFIPIFGATHYRIGTGWQDRGGYAGFHRHVQEVAERIAHTSVNKRIWCDVVPTTSAVAHEALCAVRLLASEGTLDRRRRDEFEGRTLLEQAIWRVRSAFFIDAHDISDRRVVLELLDDVGIPARDIQAKLQSGQAMAEHCRDIELRDTHRIQGSPTYYLNEGRQKLYGNAGYHVVSANVRALLTNDT